MAAELLHRLLGAWRRSRDPALEVAINRIGRELAYVRGPIAAPNHELEATWHAIAAAADPCDVDRLLDPPWPPSWLVARPRVEALERFVPDPRVAFGLARLARMYASGKSRPFHDVVIRILEQTVFPGLVPALPTGGRRGRRYARVRSLASRIEVTAADPALIAEVARAHPPERLAALAAEHAANPDNLALRGALGDALVEAGDPRGELIVLQTAIAEGRGSDELRRRVAVLLDGHARTWLAGLPMVSYRFERGFLAAATVSTCHPRLASSFDCPEWSTVEVLTIRDLEHAHALGPLLHRMPRLRVLAVRMRFPHVNPAAYRPADGPFPSIRALDLGLSPLPSELAMFPNLAVLAGAWPAVGRVRLRSLVRHAAHLGIRAIVYCGLSLSELRSLILVRVEGPPETRITLHGWHTGFAPHGWCLWLPREGGAARIAWSGGPLHERIVVELDAILDAFATTGIARVTASIEPADREAIVPSIERKLAEIERRVARGKQLVAIEVGYDSAPVDLASGHIGVIISDSS